MSDANPTPPPWLARRFRVPVEPVLIGIGLLVLLMVGYWLLVTPRSEREAGGDEAQRLIRLEERLVALEPLRERNAELAERTRALGALETRLRTLETRPQPDDATARLAPLEGRLQALEARPVADAGRLEALTARVERLAERQEAAAARTQEIAQRQDAGAARLQDALKQEHDQAVEQDARLASQLADLAGQLRRTTAELAPRLEALEAAQQRMVAMEGRMARLASLDELRAALAGGQPLGPALARLPDPPEALSRFAATPPPTESALRLAFEDAARDARQAADAAQRGDGSRPGVVDSALSRLGGLVTVRRGDTVVWGDAAEAEIERARRALEAGDLDAALGHLDRLPPSVREAMRGWTGQARALLAARAALRRLAAG